MALSPWWLSNTALGNSEGLLAAAVLWAVVAHLGGRERAALVLLTAAGLMRPEVWPFLGLYGLWLWKRERAWVIGAARSRCCCGSARTCWARAERSTPRAPDAASRARAARSSPTSRCSRCCGTPRPCSRFRP